VLADGGYRGEEFASQMSENIAGRKLEVVKRSQVHSFKVIPKRWVVERSFSWLEKCRRLWKNCERKLETSLQMVKLTLSTFQVNQLIYKNFLILNTIMLFI